MTATRGVAIITQGPIAGLVVGSVAVLAAAMADRRKVAANDSSR